MSDLPCCRGRGAAKGVCEKPRRDFSAVVLSCCHLSSLAHGSQQRSSFYVVSVIAHEQAVVCLIVLVVCVCVRWLRKRGGVAKIELIWPSSSILLSNSLLLFCSAYVGTTLRTMSDSLFTPRWSKRGIVENTTTVIMGLGLPDDRILGSRLHNCSREPYVEPLNPRDTRMALDRSPRATLRVPSRCVAQVCRPSGTGGHPRVSVA